MSESNECGICYDKEANHEMDCHHKICLECYKQVGRSNTKPCCPFCREEITWLENPDDAVLKRLIVERTTARANLHEAIQRLAQQSTPVLSERVLERWRRDNLQTLSALGNMPYTIRDRNEVIRREEERRNQPPRQVVAQPQPVAQAQRQAVAVALPEGLPVLVETAFPEDATTVQDWLNQNATSVILPPTLGLYSTTARGLTTEQGLQLAQWWVRHIQMARQAWPTEGRGSLYLYQEAIRRVREWPDTTPVTQIRYELLRVNEYPACSSCPGCRRTVPGCYYATVNGRRLLRCEVCVPKRSTQQVWTAHGH